MMVYGGGERCEEHFYSHIVAVHLRKFMTYKNAI